MSIVNKHPDKMSPLGISLVANDGNEMVCRTNYISVKPMGIAF